MLYSSIVKKRIREAFDQVNNRRWDELMNSITPRVHHRFGGRHAIGGERHDRETLRLWFERLARVLPNLQLEINNIWVKGPPWHTMVFVPVGRDGDAPERRRVPPARNSRDHPPVGQDPPRSTSLKTRKKSTVRLPPKRQPASKRLSPNQF